MEAPVVAKLQVELELATKNFTKQIVDTVSRAAKGMDRTLGNSLKGAQKSAKNYNHTIHDTEEAYQKINLRVKEMNAHTAKGEKSVKALAKSTDVLKGAFQIARGKAGLLLGGFGLGALISQTKGLRTELLSLNEQFSTMSDSTGSTSAAMGTYFKLLGSTRAGSAQVQASMKSLDEQGLRPTQQGFEQLAKLGADLSQATGLSADAFGSLNGRLAVNWKVPVDGIKQINSVMIAADFNASQLSQVMNSVNENIDKLSGFSKDGAKSAIALAAGITGATKAMTKMGINAQKATEFMNKLLDPEHFQDNALLLAKAGINYSDFANMLTSEGGKKTFFDKLGAGLPAVAQQLESIADPLARMNFGKTLGLSPEMISKLATAGPGQMQTVMRQAMADAKNQDAIAKKQQNAKEAASKLDERLHWMRMQLFSGLLPIFERNLPKFMNLLDTVFKRGGSLFKWIGERFEVLFKGSAGFFDAILNGKWDQIPSTLGEGFKLVTKDVVTQLSDTVFPMLGMIFANVLPNLIKGFGAALKGIFRESKILGIAAALYAGNKIFGPAIQLMWRIREWNQQERLIRTVQGLHGVGGSLNTGGGTSNSIVNRITGSKMGQKLGLDKVVTYGKNLIGGIPGLGGGSSKIISGIASLGTKVGPALGQLAKFAGPIGIAISALTGGFQAMGNAAKYFNQGDSFSGMTSDEREKMRMSVVDTHNASGSLASRQKVNKQGGSREMEAFSKSMQLSGAYADSQVTAGSKVKSFSAGALTLGIGPLIDSIFKTDITGAIARNFESLGASITPIGMIVNSIATVADSFSNKPVSEEILAEIDYFATKKKLGEKLSAAEELRYNKALDMEAKQRTSITDGFKSLGEKIKNFFSVDENSAIGKFHARLKDLFTNFSWDKLKTGFSDFFGSIWEKIKNFFKGIGRGIDKYMGIPWFNFTYGAKLAISELGIYLKDKLNIGGIFGTKEEIAKEKADLTTTQEQFKLFQQAYESKAMDVGTKIKRLRAVEIKDGISMDLKHYSGTYASILEEDKKEIMAKEKEKADMERAKLEELRKIKKETTRGAGYGAATAEHTKPKAERASVDTWVDFLRSSGVVEAGVAY